ncbi:MAG: NAD(P)-dependent oxidoreductase [Anaerolineae bacterium]|nr:MAG: NAD(P)-dependent oxidoreductase [Anaerolineae bacterium]
MANVLVTGAFGNVGYYVTAELLRQGHVVRCFDLRTPQTEKKAAHFPGLVEVAWGDIRNPELVKRIVQGQDVILHLAAIIPPVSDEQPELTRAVNIEGTRNLLEAAKAQKNPPRFFYASTFDLFGHTQKLPPPRRAEDPIEISDVYTETKAAGEQMVRESGLPHLIFRFSDMPLIGLRDAHPIMFEIGLYNRMETMHPADGALAVVNAIAHPELWTGRLLLVGGGREHGCQITYREFFSKILTAMGIGMLPDEAFSDKEYVTDWLDTEESQRLLQYQRHTFDQIVAEIAALLGWKRFIMPFVRPFVQRSILNMSPYWKQKKT